MATQDVQNLKGERATNAANDSNTLPDNRVAMSRGLDQQTQRLWRLVSK